LGWGSEWFQNLVGMGSPLASSEDSPAGSSGSGGPSDSRMGSSTQTPSRKLPGWTEHAFRHAAARVLDDPILIAPDWSIAGKVVHVPHSVADLQV